MNILIESDSSDSEADFDDDYFDMRMKMMDKQYEQIKSIFNSNKPRNNGMELNRSRTPSTNISQKLWKDSIDTDTSERSYTQ
jgi:hypothetical protein